MSKKIRNKSVPANVPKKYANFAHCKTCGDEQRMKRVVIGTPKKRKSWVCQSCSAVLPHGSQAKAKSY